MMHRPLDAGAEQDTRLTSPYLFEYYKPQIADEPKTFPRSKITMNEIVAMADRRNGDTLMARKLYRQRAEEKVSTVFLYAT